jgi:hypothetical protein
MSGAGNINTEGGKMKAKSVVHSIPGGWYGNDAGFNQVDPGFGVVVVDNKRLDAALRWIGKRAIVLAVGPSGDPNPGYSIEYRVKGAEVFESVRAA